MWLEKLQEAKKASKATIKWIAEQTDYTEKKITKLFSGEYKDPSAQLLHDVGALFGLDLNDLLGDGNSVVTSQTLAELHTRIEALEIENARLITENELLKIKLAHKEEIISLHNYYMKLMPNN